MFLTPGVRNLLLANIGLLLIPSLTGRLEILTEFLGLHFLNSSLFSPYQLVTHMFMHAGFTHLLFNMMGLVFFGSWLERAWGTNRFLIFYFTCGIGAGLLYMGFNYIELQQMLDARAAFMADPTPDGLADFMSKYTGGYRSMISDVEAFGQNPNNPEIIYSAKRLVNQLSELRVNSPMIGASGAVFGVIMAFGLLFPEAELFFFPLPFPVRAKYVVLFYGATALFGAIHKEPGDNVAHYAHLGGMFFGWLMVRYYRSHKI